jgi:sec-independent protein translocase protein TatA
MYYIANPANPTLWIVIGVIALLLFGGQKIPEMMKGLGSGMKEFKKGMSDEPDDELRKEKEREAEIRRRVEEEMRKG